MLSIYLCSLDEIAMDDKSVLLLPGATAWSEQKHDAFNTNLL